MGRIRWGASSDSHLCGLPRRLVFLSVGAFAKAVTSVLNTCTVHNAETLARLVRSRPTGTPLITYTCNAGKCLPIVRGGGIYQDHMNKALDILNKGCWLHTFPEGKVYQENGPIRRLKWGTASLIVRADSCPTVLPIVHSGFEKVMPEKWFLSRRPPVPLWGNHIKIVVGEPMQFDLKRLRQVAASESRRQPSSFQPFGWPSADLHALDEAAQRWLYIHISNEIQTKMEMLRNALLN